MGIVAEGYPNRLADIVENMNFGKSQRTLQLERDVSALVNKRVALSLYSCYEKSQLSSYPTLRRTVFVDGLNIGSVQADNVNLSALVDYVRQYLNSKTN